MPGDDREHVAPTAPASWRSGAPLAAVPEGSHYAAGETVAGKYRLSSVLSRGRLGDVWLAHNEILDIDVAVKLMRNEADGSEAGTRFLREARAAARLGHPAIVRIFDFGLAEHGEPFIVMERLVGEDLAAALHRRGALPALGAVRTILPVVHALAAAHAKGTVHGDLEPKNVFLARGEGDRLEPKVVGFGVVRPDGPKAWSSAADGASPGSPAYASPEQLLDEGVDHRADVWSLAAVLYETITGRPPFGGTSHDAILLSIARDEPAPFGDRIADEALFGIVAKGMKKDPRERWDSMRAFGEALADWLVARGATEDITGQNIDAVWVRAASAHDELGARPSRPASFRETVHTLRRSSARSVPRRRTVIAAAGIVVLVLGAVLWGLGGSPPKAASVPSHLAASSKKALPSAPAGPARSSPPSPGRSLSLPAPRPSVVPRPSSTERSRLLRPRPIPVKSLSQIPIDGTPAGGKKPKKVSGIRGTGSGNRSASSPGSRAD